MMKKLLTILFFLTNLIVTAQNKDSVQYQWTKSNFGFDLNVIVGYSVFTADLKDYFRSGFPYGIGLGLNYGRFNTFFRFYGGGGRTKTSFNYKGVYWSENQRIFASFPEISFGFAVLDKKVKLTPYYGLCWPSIQKSSKDSINQPKIRFNITQIYGLDFKWNCFSYEDFNSRDYRNSFNVIYLFSRVGYMSPFPNKQSNEQFKRNNSWLINFGFGFKMETRKRAKLL
jgi:opacity protein-like surface antigen